MKKIYLYSLCILFSISIKAQVPVEINSGNPNIPFPQFSAYEYDAGHRLENLANQNADGLVHAEMEKRIREAWQIMANRFEYTGVSHAGVQYVIGNIGCPYDCSEGDGYALIAAAFMGDKTIFDGLWFRTHDLRLVKHPRYTDGVVPRPGYQFGDNTLAEPGGDAATDGDVDIALGLLMAWKQWGDDSGYTAANGSRISYKEEALAVIRGLVEIQDRGLGDCRKTSGNIGLDGYFKNGNTWGELTNWASNANPCPEFKGPQQTHVDYVAPAYCKAFADFLEAEGGTPDDIAWNIPQLRRAEASSDWFMGELYKQGPNTIPVAGWVELDAANNATFSNFNEGEDFRYAWRTILNHTWHGDPTVTWNPSTHQTEPRGNSFNRDMGVRFSKFLADPSIGGNPCINVGGGLAMTFQGPSQLLQLYNPNTALASGAFPLNWLVGASTPSAVSAQDFDLMGLLYRQCAIEWDQQSGRNLDSKPVYFHGFFRLLGMLITTGNFQSPMSIQSKANIKIYNEIDKSFAFTGDEVTFTFSYRNYGSVAAQNVTITDKIPNGLEFLSASNGGILSGNTITWNLGTVPGFSSSSGILPTTGEVTVKFRVAKNFSGNICNPATIVTSNGDGWTSNRFPNKVTAVMEQNCLDIIEKALEIEKTVDHQMVNPGDIVTYDVNFENSSKGGYINGGRSGVNFAYARGGNSANGSTQAIKVRLYHGAVEPYINYENYRISLFLNDNTYDCVSGTPGCNTGWQFRANIYEGGDASKVTISQEDIVPGFDAKGAWNQRVIIQFADQLSGPTPHLLRYFGLPRIHEGGGQPLRAVWELFTSNFGSIDWSDDWSWNPAANDADGGLFYPITNDWTDPDNPNQPVTIYHNEACEKPTQTVDNILIEEWDGYAWRRIYGSGPVPGRDVDDVVFTDILPEGFELVAITSPDPLGIAPTTSILPNGRTEIRWEAPRLQIGQKINIVYTARANFSSGTCSRADEVQINKASVSAKNESPLESFAEVTVTCDPVILPPPPSSMTKIATPTSADVGDQIVYTLSYENTDGSPIEYDFTTANINDWTAQNGRAMPVSATGISSVGNDPGVSTYNFSHGTNGMLEATINFTQSAAFGFALRHTGGAKTNGLYIVFKPNSGAGTIETSVFDGLVEIDRTILGYKGNPTDIKLLLVDDQLSVWIGNTLSPTPNWTSSGLPVRLGNFGFINGFPNGNDSYATHTVTRFKTSMDSAFNLQITDPIPAEVDFVTATDSGTDVSGVVTYPELKGPILAGTRITYSWTAELKSCPSSTSKIENIAYTNILGVPVNSIAAQAIVDCSGVNLCTVLPPDPVVKDAVFCFNEFSLDLNTFITATETIIWYENMLNITPVAKPTVDTSVTSNKTYFVSQRDINGCESNRVPIVVEVLSQNKDISLNSDIFSTEAVNYDVGLGFGLSVGQFVWKAEPNINVTGMSMVDSSSPLINDVLVNTSTTPQVVKYIITTNTVSACAAPVLELLITVKPLPSIVIDATSVIEGENIEITVSLSEPAILETIINIEFTGNTANDRDLSLTTEKITIPIGEIERTLIRPTIDDTMVEPNETVNITIGNIEQGLVGGIGTPSIATIFDNDGMPNVIVEDASIVEGGILQVPVNLSSPAIDDIVLSIGTIDIETISTDYTVPSSTLTILKGETGGEFLIQTTDDTLIEKEETFNVFVSGVVQGTVGSITDQGIASIFDNDMPKAPPLTIMISNSTAKEGGVLEFDITLSGVSTELITVELGLVDVTTTASDYTINTTTLSVPAGSLTSSFRVTTLEDTIEELSETFTLSILNVTGGNVIDFSDIGIGTITDSSTPIVLPNIKVDIADASATEGEVLEFIITLSEVSTELITIELGLVDVTTTASDYTVNTTTLSIPAGNLSSSFRVITLEDTIEELSETFTLSILNITGGNITNFSDTASGTIVDNQSETVLDSDLLFPKYFTPNGDSFNDLWHVNEEFKEQVKSIYIYNRYGKLLKQITNRTNGWDGNYAGQKMPNNEYWFMAEMGDGNMKQGHFTLKR